MKTTKKLLIAGSRGFSDYNDFCRKVDAFVKDVTNVEIITGCANGTDYMAWMYANEHKLKLTRFVADWELFGKSAGPRRNREMAKVAQAAIIFWDGKSKGTENMISELQRWQVEPRKVIRIE